MRSSSRSSSLREATGSRSGVLCESVRLFLSRRGRHTRFDCDWSSDVCSSDRDKPLFISYFAFLAAVIFLAAGYHLIRERRETWNAVRAPLEAIGTRLKSRSAWIALGQVWMAVTFFQVVFYYLVIAGGINPSSPVNPTPQSAWFWLYELLNAGVYEEFAFRILLIGLPMALGSVVLRIIEVNRGGTANGPGAAGRHVGGAWRYLIGGGGPPATPQGKLVAAGGFLFGRSVIFGRAQRPGWGWGEGVPAA